MLQRGNTWFTSDFHINDELVLSHRPRFKTLQEMNKTILDNHNAVVQDGDTVYFLGDLTYDLDMAKRVLHEVRGDWHIIWGNHDQWKSLNGNKRIVTMSELRTIRKGEQKIVMCHHPFVSWQDSDKGSWNLHGHSHGKYNDPHKLQLDVGVDTNNFKPYSWDEIQVKIAKK